MPKGSPGREGDVRRILVDGRNVQGALARGTGGGSGGGAAASRPGAGPPGIPTAALIARVLAAVPPDVTTELLLDGYPSGGVIGRVGPRFRVEYTKGRSADLRIVELVEQAAAELGPIGVDGVLVVSDDRAIGAEVRRHGARVVGTQWLTDRMRRSASIGRPR